MPRLTSFTQVSLDGYFADANSDMSWAHRQDPEWNAFAAENASGGGALLFGRVTYDMMASFWPTPAALDRAPTVAEHMNMLPKFVVSRTLDRAPWNNSKVLTGELLTEVRALKNHAGPDIAILGSGSIVAQLAEASLIDEIQLVFNALVLGKGKSLFAGVTRKLDYELDQDARVRERERRFLLPPQVMTDSAE